MNLIESRIREPVVQGYDVMGVAGEGASSIVYKVNKQGSQEAYAAKVFALPPLLLQESAKKTRAYMSAYLQSAGINSGFFEGSRIQENDVQLETVLAKLVQTHGSNRSVSHYTFESVNDYLLYFGLENSFQKPTDKHIVEIAQHLAHNGLFAFSNQDQQTLAFQLVERMNLLLPLPSLDPKDQYLLKKYHDAIKMLIRLESHQRHLQERYTQELKIFELMKPVINPSSHVVSLIDSGITLAGDPYIILNYLSGKNIEASIKEGLRFTPAQAYILLTHLTQALMPLEKTHLIHYDIATKNIIWSVVPAGTSRYEDIFTLIDFDRSCTINEANQLTGTEQKRQAKVIGHREFVAPEILRRVSAINQGNKNLPYLNGTVDMYGLGVVCFRVLTGLAPYVIRQQFPTQGISPIGETNLSEESAGQTGSKGAEISNEQYYRQVLERPPLKLDECVTGVPPNLIQIVHKLISKDPKDRYPSFEALGREIKRMYNRDCEDYDLSSVPVRRSRSQN